MATSKGRDAVRGYMAKAPGQIVRNVLRGAARAAANVVADEAREKVTSDEVRSAIKVATKVEGSRIVAKVQVKGKGGYIAPWLEYGTDPHFISVDPNFSEGRTAGRINRLERGAAKEGRQGPAATLIINGKPVGATVHHPGARPHPFLRPALDLKERDAFAAAQSYINARVAKGDLATSAEPDESA